MSPEETPPNDLEAKSSGDTPPDSKEISPLDKNRLNEAPTVAQLADSGHEQGQIVEATEVNQSEVPENANVNPAEFADHAAPPTVGTLENMSANGGAIGALVLGLWCLAGSFVTNWSIINGVLGLMLGLWGLSSRKKKTAWLGIALCVIGSLLSLIQVSEIVSGYLTEVEESAF